MNRERMIELFKSEYGVDNREIKTFLSPGRVNLIGEHIDYNGGFVFPGALTVGIYAALSLRDDNKIRMRSKNVAGEVIFDLSEDLVYKKEDDWGNYPKGVVKALMDLGHEVPGMDIVLYSNIPDGAGLSSSAALEVLMAYIILYLENKEQIDRVEVSKLCQKVENEFVGVNCGIMDQFAVAVGKKDHAILLDCDSLRYEYAPLSLGDYSLVIMSTNKRRELADSKYNERRAECEKALEIINENKVEKLSNLCEVTLDDIETFISDEIIKRRAIHVVTENERVKRSMEMLKDNDILGFGKLLTASHMSLENDYEVTGLHLDTLVHEALKIDGCIGARMTGAGFGGCAIALVNNSKVEEFKEKVSLAYENVTGITPSFYTSNIGEGTHVLN
ncbi:galactokinase [uncultured Clostridium sp.]|uniref:galactokinase n=1 Tax=uncultured Clostridium sp. TaxID=59620 RepID=UPI002633DA77|nr:galactokinase [uncultured Clostridium sp.]